MIKYGDVIRWKQPTTGTVIEVNEKSGYFVIQFDGQENTWSFGFDELMEFERIPVRRGRHAKRGKR